MDEDQNEINIDGINGKWVQISTPINGWIFSGYLEKKQLSDINDNNVTAEIYELSDINDNNVTAEIYANDIFLGSWRIMKENEDYPENRIFFTIFDFMDDKIGQRFVYGQYGTGFGFFGKWKIIDDKTIELYGAWSGETTNEKDLDYITRYLREIKFSDELNTITFYNGISGDYETMKRLGY